MYLYGASGHAKVIKDIIEATGGRIDGLIDDNPMDANFGKSVVGAQNIGGVYYNFDSTGALIQ